MALDQTILSETAGKRLRPVRLFSSVMVFGITVSSRAIGRLAFVSLSLSSSCSRHFFTAGYKPVPKVDQTRRCIEISPPEGTEVKASLVFMHGLGDTASGWGGAMMDIATKVYHSPFPHHFISPSIMSLHYASLRFTSLGFDYRFLVYGCIYQRHPTNPSLLTEAMKCPVGMT